MIEIIPAIDIIDGKAVRLAKGDYNQKTVYNDNPLEIARRFEDAGIKRLHLVDLDGAKAQHVVNLKVLEKMAKNTRLIIDFGGGIKTNEDIRNVFDYGASYATIGTVAVKDPVLFQHWLSAYGSDKIILGADVKNGNIAISGWFDVTNVNLHDFVRDYIAKGVKTVLCTDISKDGMLMGASIDMYQQLKLGFPDLNIIASGGITRVEEIELLDKMNIFAVIIGKAYYEGKIKLNDLSKFL